jgi:Xaa-Pro dipeptidase
VIRLDHPDLVAARRGRVDRAAGALGLDGWLLTTAHAVRTVTGAHSDDVDLAGEWSNPIVAVGSAVVLPGIPPTDARFVDAVADLLPRRGKLAVDRLGRSAYERLGVIRPDLEIEDAAVLLAASKTPRAQVEIDVIVDATHRTERALSATLPAVRAGVSERELNAEFALRLLDEGIERLHVDTVFSVLPRDRDSAPWARSEWSDPSPYRELTTRRIVEDGDHIAFDAGVMSNGYSADVGWTLKAGPEGPTPAEARLARDWHEVAMRVVDALRPGATAADVRAAALDGWDPSLPPPWPYPLYVAHGLGTEPAEPPFAGADFAPDAEAAMVITEGHVLEVEPYIWRSGVGGYRAEYCVVVGSDETRIVSSLPYDTWPTAG